MSVVQSEVLKEIEMLKNELAEANDGKKITKFL